MNNRRILVVQESDNYTAWAPSASVGDNALLSDKLNQSSLSSALPHFTLFDKSNTESSTPDNPYDNSYDSARFNPLVAMTVVLVSVFFSLGVYVIFVCRCACPEHTGWNSRRRGGGNGTMNRASQGLDRRIIETFPVLNYSLVKGLKQGKQALECAVCLSEFEDDERLRLLPKCSHAFHPDCIDMWLFSHTTCPLCRSGLVPESRIVEQGIRVNVESQTQQGPLHAAEQVVVVVEEANAFQDIADHQDGSRNEMHPFDAGAGLNRTRPGQPSVYSEGRASATNSSIVGIMVNDLRLLEKRGQNFRRSHSTGHSLVEVGRNPEHPD